MLNVHVCCPLSQEMRRCRDQRGDSAKRFSQNRSVALESREADSHQHTMFGFYCHGNIIYCPCKMITVLQKVSLVKMWHFGTLPVQNSVGLIENAEREPRPC